jgi:hypothetical protein
MNGIISSLVSVFLTNNENQKQKSLREERFFSSVVGYRDLKVINQVHSFQRSNEYTADGSAINFQDGFFTRHVKAFR